MSRIAGIALGTATAVAAVLVAATAAGLPDPVATHFSGSGRADGWTARPVYAASMTVLTLAVPLATWLSLAWLPRRWPRLVNLPNRDHWFAPERREATLARLARFGILLSAAVLALMVSVHVGVVDANRRVPPAAGSTILVLPAVFGLAIAALGIASVLRFHRRPDIRR